MPKSKPAAKTDTPSSKKPTIASAGANEIDALFSGSTVASTSSVPIGELISKKTRKRGKKQKKKTASSTIAQELGDPDEDEPSAVQVIQDPSAAIIAESNRPSASGKRKEAAKGTADGAADEDEIFRDSRGEKRSPTFCFLPIPVC